MSRTPVHRVVRRLRDNPALGWVIRVVDRAWWWRTIRRSGLVDATFYAAQLGLRRVPADVAILHYVSRGFRRGFSVNPLFDEITAGGNLPEVFRVPAMYAYLISEKSTVQVNPLWDAPTYGRTTDLGSEGPLEHAWSRPGAEIVLTSGSRQRRVTVAALRAEAAREIRGWRGPTSAEPSRASQGSTLVLRVVEKRDRRYGAKLHQITRWVSRGDSVVLAMVSPDASQWWMARQLQALVPELRVVGYRAGADWQRVVREAVRAHSAADVFVALDPRAEFDDDDVDELCAVARTGRVASPVHLAENGTIAGAGAGGIAGFDAPTRILEEHPVEDLAAWGSAPVLVPLLSGHSVAMPRHALAGALREPSTTASTDLLENLTETIARHGVERVVLPHVRPLLGEPRYAFRRASRQRPVRRAAFSDATARVEELLALSGFQLQGWERGDSARPRPELRWNRPSPDVQRWAIKICAPPGRAGAVWGDTHFAVGLARALRRRGHVVVIDSFGASRRSSAYLDDVSVVIRGPYRISPPDTGVRMEWIISHPDEITGREIADFDVVFAASRRWAAEASRRWGTTIEPLLEATDVDQFHPRGRPRGEDIVFVGTARGIARPSVVAPIAAGVPVKVYGPDWRPFIPASSVAAESLPNRDLPERYETASIVLNDQWPAMREHGFIAMRPFDVVAVGGRVISEEVDDIEEIFEGAVVTYRDAAHLVQLLRADPAAIFPPDAELERIGAHVRAAHSFDARAAVLERAAARRRGEAGDLTIRGG